MVLIVRGELWILLCKRQIMLSACISPNVRTPRKALLTIVGGVRPAVLRQPSNTTDAVDPEVKPSFGFDLFDGCSDRVLHEYLGITFPLCPPTDSNSDRPLAPKYSQLQGVCRLVGHAYLDEQPDGHWGSDLLVDAEHSDTILLGDATGMGKTGTVAMTFRVLGEMAVQQRSALVNGGFPVSMMRSRRGQCCAAPGIYTVRPPLIPQG